MCNFPIYRNVVTYLTDDNQEILIHQLDDPNLEKLVFYDVIKTFTIQADQWLSSSSTLDCLPSGQIIIFDIKDVSLKILPKVNIMFFKDFLIFLLVGEQRFILCYLFIVMDLYLFVDFMERKLFLLCR